TPRRVVSTSGNSGMDVATALAEGLFERAPGEHGALDALGEFLHALEQLQFAERILIGHLALAGDDAAEVLEQTGGLGLAGALDFHGHHGGAGLADGATLAAELDVLNAAFRI